MRWHRSRASIAGLLALVLSACTTGGATDPEVPATTMTQQQAEQRLTELADQVLAAALPKLKPSDPGGFGSGACYDGPGGAPSGREYITYGRDLNLNQQQGAELLAGAERTGKANGFRVEHDSFGTDADIRRLHTSDGFTLQISFNAREQLASIIGSSPCVEPGT